MTEEECKAMFDLLKELELIYLSNDDTQLTAQLMLGAMKLYIKKYPELFKNVLR